MLGVAETFAVKFGVFQRESLETIQYIGLKFSKITEIFMCF